MADTETPDSTRRLDLLGPENGAVPGEHPRASIEPASYAPPLEAPPLEAPPPGAEAHPLDASADLEAHPADLVYIPLAVTVGDGFKFGCGFFLALAAAILTVVFLLAVLFALTSFLGVSLPVSQ